MLLSPLKMILIFILITSISFSNCLYSQSENSRQTEDNYNHFQMITNQNISGIVRNIKTSPDKSIIAVKSSYSGMLIRLSDYTILCNFPSNSNFGFEWDHKTSEFFDGYYIRNKNDCQARDILYGNSISWNQDGRIATIIYPQLRIWNSNNLTLILSKSDKNYSYVSWSPDGKYIAITENSKVDIHNGSNYSMIKSISMQKDETTGINSKIVWSPNSKYIAYCSNEYFIQIIDVNNTSVYKKLYSFTNSITSFAWSSDGNYIVAGSLDKTVNLYDFRNDSISTLHLDPEVAKTLDFGIDFHDLIIGTNIGTIERWRFDKNLLKAEAGPELFGITGQTINIIGSRSCGDIPNNGYSWTLSDSNGPIATLTGRTISYIFPGIGDYEIKLTVTDIYGHISTDNTIVHILQTSEKPIVKILSPINGTEVNGLITFTGTANDTSEIIKIEIEINDGGWLLAEGTNSWKFSLNTRTYQDGSYIFIVRAYNGIEFSDIQYLQFIIHNANNAPPNDPPPTIKILQPLNDSIVKGVINISGIANDNTYISEISIQTPSYYSDANGGKNWFLTFDTRTISDGKWTFRADAYDEFRQKSSASITIFINNTGLAQNTPPIISIQYPTNNTKISGLITIKGTASDDRGVKIIQLRIENNIWYTCNGLNNWQFLLNTSIFKNGLVNITARAYDGDLFSTNATLHIIINNQKNNTNITTPSEPIDQGTYIISYFFIVIIIIIISLMIYIAYLVKKIRVIFTIIIIILIIATIFYLPIPLNQHKTSNNTPNSNQNTNQSNTSQAPDFTFTSLRTGKIITNENELGNIVIIYFTPKPSFDQHLNGLEQIILHYKTNISTHPIHVLVLATATYISGPSFNSTMNKYDSSWDYQIDTLKIRSHFQSDYAYGWVIIDSKGYLEYNYSGLGVDTSTLEKIIDSLM